MFASFFSVLSGIIGERLPIRYYLTSGMLASGAFTALFGLGYFYNIHSFGFYVVTQVRSGSAAPHGWGFRDESDWAFLPQEKAAWGWGCTGSCLPLGSVLAQEVLSLQ